MGFLPTEKTKTLSSIEKLIILIYGQAGIGKTTFVAQAPDCLILAPEKGDEGLDVFIKEIRSWDDIKCALVALQTEKHSFKTVAIDTVDAAFRMCEDYICAKGGKEDISDFGHGKGYSKARSEFIRVMTDFTQLGLGLYLLGHEKPVRRPGEQEPSHYAPDIPDRMIQFIEGFCMLQMYATIRESPHPETKAMISQHVLMTKKSTLWNAKDRCAGHMGDMAIPACINFRYAEFAKYYKRGYDFALMGGKGKSASSVDAAQTDVLAVNTALTDGTKKASQAAAPAKK